MASIYTQWGGGGPWYADDDNVVCDGYLASPGHASSGPGYGPTVDGLDNFNAGGHHHGGMVHGHDGHLAHGRNSHRSNP